MIHARQMKAARALLDWSQKQLAEATHLSPTTIRNMESGEMSPRSATAKIIQRIFEECGIEFTEGEGVRLRNDTVKIYQGLDSCDEFFDDILQTVKDKGGEVVCVFKSHELFVEACGLKLGKMGPFQNISQLAPIKCIMPQLLSEALPAIPCETRAVLKQHIGPSSYFAFADKYAVVLNDARTKFKFVVFSSLSMAEDYKCYFYSLWDAAPPVLAEFNRLKSN